MLMAQAKRPMAILRNKTLRFEEMKNLADFRFITFYYNRNEEGKEEKKWG